MGLWFPTWQRDIQFCRWSTSSNGASDGTLIPCNSSMKASGDHKSTNIKTGVPLELKHRWLGDCQFTVDDGAWSHCKTSEGEVMSWQGREYVSRVQGGTSNFYPCRWWLMLHDYTTNFIKIHKKIRGFSYPDFIVLRIPNQLYSWMFVRWTAIGPDRSDSVPWSEMCIPHSPV